MPSNDDRGRGKPMKLKGFADDAGAPMIDGAAARAGVFDRMNAQARAPDRMGQQREKASAIMGRAFGTAGAVALRMQVNIVGQRLCDQAAEAVASDGRGWVAEVDKKGKGFHALNVEGKSDEEVIKIIAGLQSIGIPKEALSLVPSSKNNGDLRIRITEDADSGSNYIGLLKKHQTGLQEAKRAAAARYAAQHAGRSPATPPRGNRPT
ncbi:MAG: hypothetical protein AB7G06_00410 [Bdellovibrionales bacterium]